MLIVTSGWLNRVLRRDKEPKICPTCDHIYDPNGELCNICGKKRKRRSYVARHANTYPINKVSGRFSNDSYQYPGKTQVFELLDAMKNPENEGFPFRISNSDMGSVIIVPYEDKAALVFKPDKGYNYLMDDFVIDLDLDLHEVRKIASRMLQVATRKMSTEYYSAS